MTASAYPHSALSLLVQSSRVSTPLRAAVAEVEAYLAELDAKLEAVKGALAQYESERTRSWQSRLHRFVAAVAKAVEQ